MQTLGNVSHVLACRSSSKNTRKMNLQLISNIELFQTHMGLKLSVLAICWKACEKCSLAMVSQFLENNQNSTSYRLLKQQTTKF
jgi:hypothetical protein